MSDDNGQTPAPQTQRLDHGAAAADFFALARQIAAPPWADEATRYKALKQTLRAATSLAEADARGREQRAEQESDARVREERIVRAAKLKARQDRLVDNIINSLPAIMAAVQAFRGDDPERGAGA